MSIHDKWFPSRRELLSLGAVGGVTKLLDAQAVVHSVGHEQPQPSSWGSVTRFGATGDSTTDDTAAFQRALEFAYKSGGGTVYVPSGRYLFRGSLVVPDGVTLRGSFSCVPSHNGFRDRGLPKPGDDGSALFVTAGKGNEDGRPFLTLNTNSAVSGLTIYYPEQVSDEIPVAYPWAIAMRGKNPAVVDVELLNPYQGIDASQNERHNIRNVTGQPLRRGIWVDAIYDIGRIENAHFNPWWNAQGKVYQWQRENGEAFIFGRADWEYVLNTFCYGYRTGYKFIETSAGVCNGNFLGIGADDCNRAVLVEQSSVLGLLIANAEFTAFHGNDPTMIEVSSAHKGVVRLSNCAFWGPCNQVAKISGRGTVGFSDCTFVEWGKEGDRAAIQASSGTLLIRGCEFRQGKQHISLGERVERAIITGNLFASSPQIRNDSVKNVQIGLNSSL